MGLFKKRQKKLDSQEVGLDIGMIFLKFFLDTEYLHYGYWKDGLDPHIQNLRTAQINYTNHLFSHIPEGVKTILDVGSGTGKVAEKLIEQGYEVDCVSPSKRLTARIKERLEGKAGIFHGRYEDVAIDKKYDLVLFSESFQYIDMQTNFEKSAKYLKDGGHILICDFFRYYEHNHRPLGGGHWLDQYKEILAKHPFDIVKDEDITQYIAPTMTVVNSFTMDAIRPSFHLGMDLFQDRFPRVHRFVKWKFKKKLNDIEDKHFKGQRNAENFTKFKTYRLILLQKRAV